MFRGLIALCLLPICLGGQAAQAAVFVLKNVSFSVDNAGTSGLPTGTYNISGEFKIDTSSTGVGAMTAWNITASGPSAYTKNWVYNTSGFANNSTTTTDGTGPENQVSFQRTNATDPDEPFLTLIFGNNFNAVYIDPALGSTGQRLLDSTPLTGAGIGTKAGAASTSSPAGTADFVPFSPAPLALLPIVSAIGVVRRRKQFVLS